MLSKRLTENLTQSTVRCVKELMIDAGTRTLIVFD